jgi:hypothetical protein
MSDPDKRRQKTLVGVYAPDAAWILDHRKDKEKKEKGKRRRENTCDVVEKVVKHYRENVEP